LLGVGDIKNDGVVICRNCLQGTANTVCARFAGCCANDFKTIIGETLSNCPANAATCSGYQSQLLV